MYQTLKLRELNAFITCGICSGYLIDATTITECLHTFCRSCIVKHLQEENICPTCKIVIHHSYPMNYISSDRTMQEIVYKLVPGLQDRELQRQKEFEVAMFMYRTGEQQNAYNAMNSTKILGNFLFITASFVVLRFLKKCISFKFFGPKKSFPLYFHTCSLQINEHAIISHQSSQLCKYLSEVEAPCVTTGHRSVSERKIIPPKNVQW